MNKKSRWVTILVAGLAAALIASRAGAAVITEFPLPTANSYPAGICLGPDGALWFTEIASPAKIGRITTAGVITEFTVPTGGGPYGICLGPDSALWFTGSGANKIGRVTTTGAFTEFTIPTANSGSTGICLGPDGNLWFTEYAVNKIGRITPAGVFAEFIIPSEGSYPHSIVSGPDGNLWFTEGAVNRIGRITTLGVITEFPTPGGGPIEICLGPDGALWFTEGSGNIGRITTAGVISEFSIPGPTSGLRGITTGSDENLWFTEMNDVEIGRMTTSGLITEFNVPTAASTPEFICLGPDGALWFTEYNGNRIGRLSLATGYYTLPPCRVLDTRGATGPLGGPSLAPSQGRSFPFVGTCGIPADALVVSGNVTAVTPSATGDFRVYAADQPTSPATVINFRAGKTIANNALVALSVDGTQSITTINDSAGTVDFLFDVTGYFK